MPSKAETLKGITFGRRIAEEEISELSSYFVETDQWQRIYAGDIDVVYGAKGTGKSAIYSLLLNRQDQLIDRHIIVTAGENPRGTPAFKDLVADPPATQEEFRALWKLYLLTLVGEVFREYGIDNDDAQRVQHTLEQAGLLPKEFTLRGVLRSALDYTRNLIRVESAEGGIKFDPVTGNPTGLSGKITFREPNARLGELGYVSADTLFNMSSVALQRYGYKLWILLDRLDVGSLKQRI